MNPPFRIHKDHVDGKPENPITTNTLPFKKERLEVKIKENTMCLKNIPSYKIKNKRYNDIIIKCCTSTIHITDSTIIGKLYLDKFSTCILTSSFIGTEKEPLGNITLKAGSRLYINKSSGVYSSEIAIRGSEGSMICYEDGVVIKGNPAPICIGSLPPGDLETQDDLGTEEGEYVCVIKIH